MEKKKNKYVNTTGKSMLHKAYRYEPLRLKVNKRSKWGGGTTTEERLKKLIKATGFLQTRSFHKARGEKDNMLTTFFNLSSIFESS